MLRRHGCWADHQRVKILVTGGTGFVGSHVAAALVTAGHDVRVLARHAEQVPVTFGPLGDPELDVAVGDVLDRESVRAAVAGCEAVVHAAAVFSFDSHDRERMLTTNEQATRAVLEEAVAAGADPVVHVSSTVALTRRDGSGPDLPLGDVDQPYAASKVASERVARELQDRGDPVVTVYPGSVLGPHDPYIGENTLLLEWVVRGWLGVFPAGGLHFVDVRDVAAVVVAAMEPGRGPRRYVVPGHHVRSGELHRSVTRVTGRRRPALVLPVPAMMPVLRLSEAAGRRLPQRWHTPVGVEGPTISQCDTIMHDEPARTELGVMPRPLDDTVRDTISWLVDAGLLPKRYALDHSAR